MRRDVMILSLVCACGASPPKPAPAPPPVREVAAVPPAAPRASAIDPRLAAVANRRDVAALPQAAGRSAAASAAGPVLQIVTAGVFVDDAAVASAAELAAHPLAGSVLLWADANLKLRDARPYLEAVPSGASLYLIARAGTELRTLSASVLGDRRCVAFLAATDASIDDVARAAASAPAAEPDAYLHDARVCGGSVLARLDAQRDGHASVFVRAGSKEPACHRLTFGPQGELVRDADGAGHPRLAFEVAIAEDSIAVQFTPPATRSVPVVRCHAKYALKSDSATGVTFAVPQRSVWGPSTARELALFYSEQDCLAAPAPSESTVECMRSMLDGTSPLPDAVVDRIAPIMKHPGKLYELAGNRCVVAVDFHPPKKPGRNDSEQDSTAYNGYALEHTSVELGAGGDGSAEVHEEIQSVVQTKDDYVLVGRSRAYLSEAACRNAAKAMH